MKVTAYDEQGQAHYISLPKNPVWEGRDQAGTGITYEAIWVSPKARRCVVQYDSIWENRQKPGQCMGTGYSLITEEDALLRLGEEYSEVAEALEACGMVAAEAL